MRSKLIQIIIVGVFTSPFVLGSDDVVNEAANRCDIEYSACLTKCDENGESNSIQCYDSCDEIYSSCLEKIEDRSDL